MKPAIPVSIASHIAPMRDPLDQDEPVASG
jgi:hypothetical protein